MKDLKIVNVDDLHQKLVSWITENRVIIGDYEDMKDMILKMIRSGHCFIMERDRLRDAMEDISYMMNSEDDALKDRVLKSLEYEDEDTEEDEGYEEFINRRGGCSHNHKPPEPIQEPTQEPIQEPTGSDDGIEDIGDTSDKK